jgi:hypothetical protein
MLYASDIVNNAMKMRRSDNARANDVHTRGNNREMMFNPRICVHIARVSL